LGKLLGESFDIAGNAVSGEEQVMLMTEAMAILAEHAGVRVNGRVASDRTQEVTKEVISSFINTLDELNLRPQQFKNIGDKHLRAVVRHWYFHRKLKPKTLQNYVSRLRIFFKWIGRPTLVLQTTAYLDDVDPKLLKVRTVADASKSWSANNIDVEDVIRRTGRINQPLQNMLRMQLAFGLRRKEVIRCYPWKADRGTVLRVFEGDAKGTKGRDIPIETAVQRAVLDDIKNKVRKTKSLKWEYMDDGRVCTLKQAEKRYSNYMAALGITKEDLGVTGHGLRAQYAENTALILGFVPGTLGGKDNQIDPEDLAVMKTITSENLGHHRISVTGAYYGEVSKTKSPYDEREFGRLLKDGAAALDAMGNLEKPTGQLLKDCLYITHLVGDGASIDLAPVHAYALWKIHSARFAQEWVPPEYEVRPALEAAARHAILIHERSVGKVND
jgi:site-specific recombinase XerC